MDDRTELYIGGKWVASAGGGTVDVLDATTGELLARVPAGTETDVDDAVAAARSGFDVWSQSSIEERVSVLRRIADGLVER
ncbi:aldehyde dehydrogenase family protein, partial [Rhodococcus sp. EPR-147]